jgi:hypothetical protein
VLGRWEVGCQGADLGVELRGLVRLALGEELPRGDERLVVRGERLHAGRLERLRHERLHALRGEGAGYLFNHLALLPAD